MVIVCKFSPTAVIIQGEYSTAVGYFVIDGSLCFLNQAIDDGIYPLKVLVFLILEGDKFAHLIVPRSVSC